MHVYKHTHTHWQIESEMSDVIRSTKIVVTTRRSIIIMMMLLDKRLILMLKLKKFVTATVSPIFILELLLYMLTRLFFGFSQVLSPDMSLATVRAYIWKKSDDLVLNYKVLQGR